MNGDSQDALIFGDGEVTCGDMAMWRLQPLPAELACVVVVGGWRSRPDQW
jgi:hypothetical protein